MSSKKHAVLHVVQASYGDALILEYDDGTGNAANPQFMVIDGGPTATTRYYQLPPVNRPKSNLFTALNYLSGEDSASQPPYGKLKKINTVVLTHDDEDHKQGIQDVFAALLNPDEDRDKFNAWLLGDRLVKNKTPAIDHIWYNSLRNIATATGQSPEDNWFDQQLKAYSANVPIPGAFNDDIAKDSTLNNVALAMEGVEAASGGGEIKRGQFTISFIGPSEDTITKPKLLKALGATNSVKIPKYDFEEEVDQKVGELSKSALKDMQTLAKTGGLNAKLDNSIKNRASIAFCAADGNNKILLLGDGNATMFRQVYEDNGKVPLDYTIMKIMHHGSKHNNYWSETGADALLNIFKDIPTLSKFQKCVTYFFSKIRAEKYVISASPLEKHPNPHVTTVLGIMLAAQENNKPVSIYFTNPMFRAVVKAIWDFKNANNKIDFSKTTYWLLAEDSDFGTVDLYNNGRDECWVMYDASGKDVWNSYDTLVKSENPTIAAITFNKPVQPPKKKPKTTKLTSFAAVSNLAAAVPSSIVLPHPSVSVAAPLVVPKVAPSQRTSQHGLLGTSSSVTHDAIAASEPFPTTQISDFTSMLQYLVSKNCILSTQASQIQHEATSGQGYTLSAICALFFGIDQASEFLASMPCNLASSTDFLSFPDAPSRWIVTNFTAKVVDTTAVDNPVAFAGWKGIYSITFDVASPQGTPILWTFPFAEASPDQNKVQYRFQHDGAMNITVVWPAYVQRITSGCFQGTLALPTKTYNVVGRLYMLTGQATQYEFLFADSSYSTTNYTISINDMLTLFNTQLTFSDAVNSLAISGLESVLGKLSDTIPLNNGGFTLKKILSKVVLKQIFADLDFDSIPAWKPFGSTSFSFGVSQLHIVLNDVYSSRSRNLILQLDGDMAYHNLSNSSAVIPFELTAQFTLQQFMFFEVAILPGIDDELTISELLTVVGLPSSFDLSQTFSGVSNLSNSLSISHVALGWMGNVLPKYATITVSIDDWTLIPNVLSIEKISVEVQASNLSSLGPAQLALAGWGTLMISDIEVDVYLNVIHDPSSPTPDIANFRISTQEQDIPLGVVLAHFFEQNFNLFPQSFDSLLTETGIENFAIQAVHDANGWSITELQIAVRVDGRIDVFENIELEYPTLTVVLQYPFDTTRRTIYTALDTTVFIGDIASSATILVSSQAQTEIALTFTSEERPVTLQAVLAYFIPDLDSIAIPPSLTFFLGLGIQSATLVLDLVNGKFSVSEVSVGIISTSSLKLWDELTLNRISLLFSYSKTSGNKVLFDTMLEIGDGSNYLNFSLLYDGPPTSVSPSVSPSDPGTAITVPPGSSWTATATYDGTISVVDALSRVSGIDIREKFTSLSLSQLCNVIDINISNLSASLIKNPNTMAFTFIANTDWLFFSNIRFACSRTTKWSYSLGFGLQSSDQLSTTFPVLKPIFDVVSFSDVTIVVFTDVLDPGALPPKLNIPQRFTHDGINVAFAGQLAINGTKLGLFGKLLDYASLDILGVIGDEYLSLSVSLKSVTLFNGDMSLAGAFVMICSQDTNMMPKIGIQGTAVFDFGEHVSKSPVTTSLLLFVDTSTTALGFTFKLDKWESVFGFDGLSFENVVFSAEFPPEEFPVPSAFTVAGTIKLTVNDAYFGGSVDVHFEEMALTKSYAMGSIEGLTLQNIIKAFTGIGDIPEYLDAGFGPLDFKLVPQDIVNSKGELTKKEFKMKGSMEIEVIHFAADVDIDISETQIVADGRISPIVVVHEQLFSILASPEETPTPPPGSGASIHISLLGDEEPGVKISGQFTFLSMTSDIFFSLTEKGLEFDLEREWVIGGAVSGLINKDGLSLSGTASLSLQLELPTFTIGSVEFGTIPIASFAATLGLSVIWNNVVWSLSVGGSFDVFGLSMSKSVTVGGDIQDLEAIGKAVGDEIKKTFTTDFLNTLKAISSDLKKVIDILDKIGLSTKDILKFITESLGAALDDAVNAVKTFFGMGWDAIASIMQGIGKAAEEVGDVFKKLGCEAYDMAVAIARAFGNAVQQFCGKILQDAGKVIKDVATFFIDIFSANDQGVVDALIELAYDVFDIVDVVCDLFKMLATAVWDLIHGSRSKKSQEQVQKDLLLILLINANSLVANPIPINGSAATQLQDVLNEYALTSFSKEWQYAYAGKNTTPPGAIIPPAVTTFDGMLSFTDGQWSGFAELEHMRQLEGLNDLPKGNTWQVVNFLKMYTSEDGQSCIKANAVIVFANGALTEDGHDVTQTVMYYMGVYFNIVPPTIAAKQALRAEALQKASSLMNNGKPIANDASLQAVLETYTANLFQSQFQFSYNSTPPDLPTGGSFLNSKADALDYLEDKNVNDIGTFVQTKLINKLSLPQWVNSIALTDMMNDFKSVVSVGAPGFWTSENVDRTYNPSDGVSRPVRCKGVIVYYTQTKSTDDGVEVEIAYIFFLGVFYEILPPDTAVFSDLVRELYINLVNTMGGKPDPGVTPTPDALKELLATYSRSQFQRKYGVDYKGNSTAPGDSAGGAVYGTESFRQFQPESDSSVLGTDISGWVDSVLVSSQFPLFNQVPAMRTDFMNEVEYLLSPAAAHKTNYWDIVQYERSYNHPTNSDQMVNISATFIYVNGSTTEQTTTVKASFVYYLGVAYVGTADDW
ncbi:hypothetical protein AX16_008934 [Volvariella volvacea WC 439]|nr:hypothetical protein AX16_008934 [Volvariella volvacea WC 439]